MHIDDVLAQIDAADFSAETTPEFTIPANWGQGRTIYGGMSGAMVFEAIKTQVSNDRPMRSFNCNFIGPLLVDEPFTIDVEILRSGRNATQAVGKIIQNDRIAIMAQACFAVDRKSKVTVENFERHELPKPKKPNFIPPIPKLVPKFIRHLDLALIEGKYPFTGSKENVTKGWTRFTKPPAVVTDAHLIALIDAFPCTVLQTLKWPCPASTMNWNIEFLHPHDPIAPTDWLAYSSFPRQAADGYCHMESDIWDANGKLIAISRQVVGVFD